MKKTMNIFKEPKALWPAPVGIITALMEAPFLVVIGILTLQTFFLGMQYMVNERKDQ